LSDEKKSVQEEEKIKIGNFITVRVEADKSTSGTLVSQNHSYSNNDQHFAY
jgi:hypothetical protein